MYFRKKALKLYIKGQLYIYFFYSNFMQNIFGLKQRFSIGLNSCEPKIIVNDSCQDKLLRNHYISKFFPFWETLKRSASSILIQTKSY